MANKFNRIFRVLIQVNESATEDDIEFLEISNPFTVQFSIDRNVNSALNRLSLKIFNLSEKTRSQIFKDRFSISYKRIIFQAGYNSLKTCFQGNIFSAFSERQGSDIVTTIESLDGGYDFENSIVSNTFSKETALDDIIGNAIDSFSFITKGFISKSETKKRRAVVHDGKTSDLLKKEVSGVFVDKEKLNILKDNEYIDEPIMLFSSESGLLGTPKRQDSYITIDVLFEPEINIGQIIQIESKIQKEYNGQYKVIGVQHSGIISDATGGQVKTTISLLVPNQITGDFIKVSL